MAKWSRVQFQPGVGLGENGNRVTASKEHIALSCEAAREGMVLLKNENQVLPLQKGARVALFGKATIDYVKGGGGSGDVTVSYIRNLYEGFKQLEARVEVFQELAAFYEENVKQQYKEGKVPGMTVEPEVPKNLLQQARAYTDTAIISICRFSGEDWDRRSSLDEGKAKSLADPNQGASIFERGDFYLTNAEEKMVQAVTDAFPKVVVVLNVGGMVDTTWFHKNNQIQSVLLALQGGMEGGLAAAQLLCGLDNPSGKLVDTYAERLEDYPSSANFHESDKYVDYTDDIYVGYRYFETIPGMAQKVVYPFGYGLSYTSFRLSEAVITKTDDSFLVELNVTNTGDMAGKEVVQVYAKAPQGKLGKPARSLVAFEKTRLLLPGESQRMTLTFDRYQLASFDDLGKVQKSAYVCEKGIYSFYVGTSVRDTKKNAYEYCLEQDEVVEQLSSKMAPTSLAKRMLSDGSFEALPTGEPVDTDANLLQQLTFDETEGFAPDVEAAQGVRLWNQKPEDKKLLLLDVAEGRATLEEFMAQLTDRQLAVMLGGQPNTGVADTFGFGNLPQYGVPNVMTADGPAGLRIQPHKGICTTAWPCATLLASSFNTRLVERIGEAGGLEVKENNIGVWLTPAINIHRSPLCGRNFEYYSEDPYLAGKMGIAMVKGIQSNHIGASVKHFALNNKETNRKESDSRASERAIREIYLKAFEMIVKEADPWTIMSSYNIINGRRASENKEMLDGILRDEWGFQGMVTTDWWTRGEHYKELLAGNDMKMAKGYPDRLMRALEQGAISRADLERSVRRVLELIMKVD